MRFAKQVGLFVLYPFLMLVTGFVTGMLTYRFFYPDYAYMENIVARNLQNSSSKDEMIGGEISGEAQNAYENLSDGEAVEEKKTVASVDQRLTADTEYVVIANDLRNDTNEEIRSKLPHKYIGMDRDQFLSAMENYEAGPPLSEREKGFVGLQVLRFSGERVVVRMDYYLMDEGELKAKISEEQDLEESVERSGLIDDADDTDAFLWTQDVNESQINEAEEAGEDRTKEEKEGFYLAVYQDEVVVYKADKKTYFVGTGIKLESLPEVMQKQIIEMMWLPDEKSLFGFLEAYSS